MNWLSAPYDTDAMALLSFTTRGEPVPRWLDELKELELAEPGTAMATSSATRRTNIECKYKCADLNEVAHRAVALGAADHGVLQQRDVYFQVPHGRLKVRTFADGTAEVIAYQRETAGEPRPSQYVICKAPEPDMLIGALTLTLGAPAVVTKTRHLFLYGTTTRIHLDRVRLGDFVELETVVTDQSLEDARAELDLVAAALGLTEIVAHAYVDLLAPGSYRR